MTREISAHLAELAKSLEEAGHRPRVVADFLTRCLFCMFAEDVGLLPERVKAAGAVLAVVKEPATAAELAKRFSRARAADVGEILETLCAMGKARRGKVNGTFLP